MTDWTVINDSQVDPDAPLTSGLAFAWRDNPIAIAEGDRPGAPLLASGWHPYTMFTVGGVETGIFYNFAVNGLQATVTSPDIPDHFDAGFLITALSHNSGVNQTLRANLFRATSAVYAGAVDIFPTSFAGTSSFYGFASLDGPRRARNTHSLVVDPYTATTVGGGGFVDGVSSTAFPTTSVHYRVTHTTAQKISRVQFSFSGGSIDGGTIAMYLKSSY